MSERDPRWRRMVRIAAAQTSIKYLKNWLLRDERGMWERQAASLWEQATPLRLQLGMSESDAEQQLGLHLCLLGLEAMSRSEKRKGAA